ncbi:MAG: hypothetical protein ABI365_01955 [Lysobacteraceae bacterium]
MHALMRSIRARRFAFVLLLACGVAHAGEPPVPASGQVQGVFKLVPVKPTFAPASAAARAAVKLHVEQGKSTGKTGPGFLVTITGWTPNGRITAELVGAKGKSVYVIPFEQPMQLGPDGMTTFLVPYQLDGLAPGAWTLVIDGASGEHSVKLRIPAINLPAAGATQPKH